MTLELLPLYVYLNFYTHLGSPSLYSFGIHIAFCCFQLAKVGHHVHFFPSLSPFGSRVGFLTNDSNNRKWFYVLLYR